MNWKLFSIFIEGYIDFISEANRKSTWTKESIRKLVNQMHIALVLCLLCGKSVGILFFFHRCCWYCSIIFFFENMTNDKSSLFLLFIDVEKYEQKTNSIFKNVIVDLIYCRCHWYLLWWRRLLDYLNIFHTFVHNFCFSLFFVSFIV